jgi:hypothetical protein
MNFIHQEYLQDLSICDRIIEYHKNGKKFPGCLGDGSIDTQHKDSTDCNLQGPLLREYAEQIRTIIQNYVNKFPECNAYHASGVKEDVNIQHYAPGQGYKSWHCERGSGVAPFNRRHLVFMTYLNDVTDGGGTEFKIQNIKVEARKGLTLVWPVDWTYTHRGEVSPTQDKYIITGWFSYLNE